MKAKSTFSLKDQLFNANKVEYLATLLAAANPAFEREAFQRDVVTAFPQLELKERIAHITTTLQRYLPANYRDALGIILAALPPVLDPEKSDDDYGDFILAPLSLFVATSGCSAEDLEPSLHGLREITKRFSAEDAMRRFLNAFPDESLAFLHECARDDHYHVRRLASESTRPLLPWAQRLKIDYRAPLPILDLLFADATRYVTRSVANHLNDISKLDAALVIEVLQRWRGAGRQKDEEMQFITRHALRTLVKRGHAGALALIGFGSAPAVEVVDFSTSTPRVRLGDAFRFSLTLRAHERQHVLIDYVMTYAGDGRGVGRKVFKLKQLILEPHEPTTIRKIHPMRLMTTRRLHAGEHRIELQVNGRPYGALTFDLVTG